MRIKSQTINIFDVFGTEIDLAFVQYNIRHPEVYGLFCSIAQDLIKKGHKHYSADAILHVIRYQQAIKKDALDLFKINNNYSSRFARKFMLENPKHAGFFETRILKSVNQ